MLHLRMVHPMDEEAGGYGKCSRIRSVIFSIIRLVQLGVRRLRSAPGYTAAVIACLSLGIAMNCMLLSAFQAVLLHRLPYRDSQALVAVGRVIQNLRAEQTANVSWHTTEADVLAWGDSTITLGALAAFSTRRDNLAGVARPEIVTGAMASHALPAVLGVRPLLGRWYSKDEAFDNVVVLSHELWTRQFASDPDALGKILRIDGAPWTVIGILPPRQGFPLDAEYWIPWRGGSAEVIGRMRPGLNYAGIARELEALAPRPALKGMVRRSRVVVASLSDHLFGSARQSFNFTMGAAGILLLLTFANVTNLSFTRALERRQEFAIRATLGAGKRSLVALVLTENMLLAIASCVAGVSIANWATGGIVAIGPEELRRIGETGTGPLVIVVAILGASILGMLLSIGPIVSFRERSLRAWLTGAREHSVPVSQRSTRRILVTIQLAVAIVLLTVTGQLLRSAARATSRQQLGFEPNGLSIATLHLTTAEYQNHSRRSAFITAFIENARRIPGVTAVSVGPPPLVSGDGERVTEGFSSLVVYGDSIGSEVHFETVWVKQVDDEYFDTYGIRLLHGRAFGPFDDLRAPPVAIVNRAAARMFFGDDWQRRGLATLPVLGRVPRQVVGVVDDALQNGVGINARPEVYLSLGQDSLSPVMPTFGVRGEGQERILAEMRRLLVRLDPGLAATRMEAMEDVVDSSMRRERYLLLVLGMFASLALVISTLGVFALMAYSVAQRRREIGIRVALGAAASDVQGSVLKEAIGMAILGASIGITAAMWFHGSLSSRIPMLTTPDHLVTAAVMAILILCALCAALIPAWRAARVEPMQVLRRE